MKGKAVLGLLALIVTLVLSATAAQAGSGGSPSTLTGFFVCHTIKGADPGREFDVESPVFGPVDAAGTSILQRVKIGKAALACAFARLWPPQPAGTPRPTLAECDASPGLPGCPIEPGTAEQMTCYPLSNSNKAKVNPPPQYDVFGDALFGDPLDPGNVQEDVPVPPTELQYLCSPGFYSRQ
jgi:hypothetical protein